MHFAVFFIFVVCLHSGLSIPTKTGYSPEEWIPIQTYDRGEDVLSLLGEESGSGDADEGSGDILPVPTGGFSKMRLIDYSADIKQTSPFFGAAVKEVVSEVLSSEDSTVQVTVEVNDVLASGDDTIVEYSVDVGGSLWNRAKTDAILYDNLANFVIIFGSDAVVIPYTEDTSKDQLTTITLLDVTDETFNELAFRKAVAEALNSELQLAQLFSLSSNAPKVPYHADNVVIEDITNVKSGLRVSYYVVLGNGNVTPSSVVYTASKNNINKLAEATGASDAHVIEPDNTSEFPSWAIAASVIGGLVGISAIAILAAVIRKRRSNDGYEDLDRHTEVEPTVKF